MCPETMPASAAVFSLCHKERRIIVHFRSPTHRYAASKDRESPSDSIPGQGTIPDLACKWFLQPCTMITH